MCVCSHLTYSPVSLSPKEKEKLKKRYSNFELFREKYSKRISLLVPKQVLLMKMPFKKKIKL